MRARGSVGKTRYRTAAYTERHWVVGEYGAGRRAVAVTIWAAKRQLSGDEKEVGKRGRSGRFKEVNRDFTWTA